MGVNEHSIKVENTAHYVSLGELNRGTKEIWIVCHGYGQLAKFFIRKFKILQKEGVHIVAPQGFHKFYLKGFSGRVGASWMTKENRDDEITDHCNFLEQLTGNLINSASKNCKINVLGFSQGAATISRWCLQTNIRSIPLFFGPGKLRVTLILINTNQNTRTQTTTLFLEQEINFTLLKLE